MKAALQKTTLGEAMQMGLLTPDGERVSAINASTRCWIVWPDSVDEPAAVYLNEGDALNDLDRQAAR